jgi:hypothetical protein
MNQLITRHARQRLRQRGARREQLGIVLDYGDIEILARNGCRFVRLSHSAVRSLHEARTLSVQALDQAARLMLLIDANGRIVTAFKCDPSQRHFSRTARAGRR